MTRLSVAFPILRDDDEWIYQDNEYPVYPGVVEDYDEEIDEQFDLPYDHWGSFRLSSRWW